MTPFAGIAGALSVGGKDERAGEHNAGNIDNYRVGFCLVVPNKRKQRITNDNKSLHHIAPCCVVAYKLPERAKAGAADPPF